MTRGQLSPEARKQAQRILDQAARRILAERIADQAQRNVAPTGATRRAA